MPRTAPQKSKPKAPAKAKRKPRPAVNPDAPYTLTGHFHRLLREEMDAGKTLLCIAYGSHVNQSVLWRFLNEHGRSLNLTVADKLTAYFGLELRPAPRR